MMKWIFSLSLLISFNALAQFSAVTYNIRNFDNDSFSGKTDTALLGQQIKDLKSDVYAFVEVVNKKAFKDLVMDNIPTHQYVITECGGGGKQNLAVVYNPKIFNFVSSAEDSTFSMGGSRGCGSLRPVFIVTLEHKATKTIYTFIVGHLKAGGDERAFKQRWQQYGMLEKLLAKYAEKNYVLMGDLNTTGFNIDDEDGKKFHDLLLTTSSYSVSEKLECTSYWDGGDSDPEMISSILDHVIVSNANKAKIQGVELGTHCAKMKCRPGTAEELGRSFTSVSDHCPIKVNFSK